jgi:hypothetical protein
VPADPEKTVGDEEEQETDACRQQMEEIEIADGDVDAESAAKAGKAHYGDDFSEAAGERRRAGHEEEQAADRAEASAKAGAVVGDDRNQCWRYAVECGRVYGDEAQIGGDEDGGHSVDGNGEAGEDYAESAGPQETPAPLGAGVVLVWDRLERCSKREFSGGRSPETGGEDRQKE